MSLLNKKDEGLGNYPATGFPKKEHPSINPWELPQVPVWPPSETPAPLKYVTTPLVINIEPVFKSNGTDYVVKIPLLGHERESIVAKVINSNLSIIASNGGLEGNETASFCVKIPVNADTKFDSVLLNGILTITSKVLPVVETSLTIR